MTFSLGTVSEGTLRSEDLLVSFADELERQIKAGNYGGQVVGSEKRASDLVAEARNFDAEAFPEAADEIVGELMEELDACCPSYVRFGAHEGDGADFGFWPNVEALEEAARYGEVVKVNDLSELDDVIGFPCEVMLVNDHGNVTFGTADSPNDFVEIWSCV